MTRADFGDNGESIGRLNEGQTRGGEEGSDVTPVSGRAASEGAAARPYAPSPRGARSPSCPALCSLPPLRPPPHGFCGGHRGPESHDLLCRGPSHRSRCVMSVGRGLRPAPGSRALTSSRRHRWPWSRPALTGQAVRRAPFPAPKSALTRVIFGRGSRSTLPHGRLQPVLQARSRGCGGVAGLAHRSVL